MTDKVGMSAAAQIAKLRREIEHHNELYYTKAEPEISDPAFDALLRELIELETAHPELITPDSPTQRVGGAPIEGFKRIRHASRMMSIDNTYDEDEVRAFDERVRGALPGQEVRYILEPKVDGVSLSIRYEGGVMKYAVTRGNGEAGDDVSSNVRTIHDIPLKLREGKKTPKFDVLEIRGEVFMDNAEFQRINKLQVESGGEAWANPRNFTAGTLKQLDPKITASRRLRFVMHGFGEIAGGKLPDSYAESVALAGNLGMPTGEKRQAADSIEQAIKIIEAFKDERGTLAYQTDGMVVKVDSRSQRETLGVTSKAPRWAFAFKYPAEQVQTVLNAVDWQVGRAGTLTPVARLTPVFVAGSTVSNATLHNIEQIERLDLHLGDTIVLEKAGEVIPYIVRAVEDKRPSGAKKVSAPRKCPACGEPVEKEPDGPYIRCENPTCPAQLKERLKYFCARNQMNIEGVGEALIEQLVNGRAREGICRPVSPDRRATRRA